MLRGGRDGDLAEQIAAQGNLVRTLKLASANKTAEELAAAIDKLKELKKLLNSASAGNAIAAGNKSKNTTSAGGPSSATARKKGETLEGITMSKEHSFGEWYSEVVVKSELIDYYDVSGCYILRPWAFAIWEFVQKELDTHIKGMGVQGCYFPMFVSEKSLTAEQDHVEGFTPEVAWVTKTGYTPALARISTGGNTYAC